MFRILFCGLVAGALLLVNPISEAGSTCCPASAGKEVKAEKKTERANPSKCDSGSKEAKKDCVKDKSDCKVGDGEKKSDG